MESVFSVFINGISGVFTGIAVLYVMMKVLSLTAGRPASASSPAASKTA
ncbi:MAG: hypothetical protein QF681_00675 [Vicinamibacterales bacterium]|jgi:ABC-type antimicrobial peptide transport system permease subunit|nr:hypothetical protein [Vicinamibacterales bacterium]